MQPGVQHLATDPEVLPSVSRVRRIPHAKLDYMKAELQRMETGCVIEKVEQPWESNLVTNGKVRICIDPQQLNKARKKERYLMPTIDNILPMLQGAKVFLNRAIGTCGKRETRLSRRRSTSTFLRKSSNKSFSKLLADWMELCV